MQIGDRVVSRKLGPYLPTTIVGILDSTWFTDSLFSTYNFRKFEEEYPDYHNGYVYICAYDKKISPYSIKEYEDSIPDEGLYGLIKRNNDLKKEYINLTYDATKTIDMIILPEADLELL